MIILRHPLEIVPDLSTRGGLLRFRRLRDVGFTVRQAVALADAGYDVLGYVPVVEPQS